LGLRIPVSLIARIEEAADADHRSVNSWAIATFEAALREQQSKRRT
jgi:predicted HicB family RNase H-like nuclease